MAQSALRVAAAEWLVRAVAGYVERTGKRITDIRLAEESGISRPTISKIRNKKTDPDRATLVALHKVLGGPSPPALVVGRVMEPPTEDYPPAQQLIDDLDVKTFTAEKVRRLLDLELRDLKTRYVTMTPERILWWFDRAVEVGKASASKAPQRRRDTG